MSVLTQEQYMQAVRDIIGENNDDNALAFIENMTDTYNNLASNNSGTDWEQRFKDNDAMWREKYRQRFFDSEVDTPPTPSPQPEPPKPKTFDDLFKEGV